MATKKRLSLIYELENFANTYLGKVTKFQGDGLFRFGVLNNLLSWRWKTPPPGVNRVKIPKLSDVERESCEGLLTKKECWDALQRMKNDKSPGNDGLTKEFYVCFFNEVSSILITALNYSFTTGMLSTSQRQAPITLIYKKLAANLLNKRRHKNSSEALAAGRYIGESIRLITDLLQYTEENSIGGILFSADFEKAFDSIEHSFNFATLKSFGFGAQFIQWIRSIFVNMLRYK